MFKNLFEDKICDALIEKVRTELGVALPAEINKLIADTDGSIEVMPKWVLDFASSESGQITEEGIGIGARGILYDSDFPEVVPTFPTMPFEVISDPSGLQTYISEEAAQQALDSFLQVHPVQGWFNATELPADSKVQLTTGFLEKAFKGISEYYGPDCPVNVQYDLKSLHGLNLAAAVPSVTLLGDIDLKFWVDGVNGTDLAVDLSVTDFTFEGTVIGVLKEDIMTLQANITKLHVKHIVVNSDTFGKIGTFKLQMGLNVALAVLAPKIETKIDGLTIPTTINKYLGIIPSSVSIMYYDGFVSLGATPTFTAPPLPPAPVDTHEASTICVQNKAGFVLKFHLKDKYTKVESDDSEHFPIDQTKCMDIKTAFPNIREGEVIATSVKASGGVANSGNHLTVYKADAGLFTTFTCRGTTLFYHCDDEFLSAKESVANELASFTSMFFQ